MSLLVNNPVLNSPFEEPARYWTYEEGQSVLNEGLRLAGYYLKARTRCPQMALLEEEFIPLELVNTVRQRVKAWRERGYLSVTPITRQLLNHWNNPERKHLEITFPSVAGCVFDARSRLRVDWDGLSYLLISPTKPPTEVVVKPAVGYRIGRMDPLGPGARGPARPKPLPPGEAASGHDVQALCRDHLWPQGEGAILHRPARALSQGGIVWEYLEKRVVLEEDTVLEEMALLKYRQQIVERLTAAVEPDVEVRGPPRKPESLANKIQ